MENLWVVYTSYSTNSVFPPVNREICIFMVFRCTTTTYELYRLCLWQWLRKPNVGVWFQRRSRAILSPIHETRFQFDASEKYQRSR